jgi:diguanylate cyclase (GGDEF)-like protein/PAS domain S-box-containing protein
VPGSTTRDVLVICERRPLGESLLAAIESALHDYASCEPVWNRASFNQALTSLERYDAIILGADLGWSHGLSVLAELLRLQVAIPIVMVTDSNGVDLVAEGFRMGMHDFLRSSQLDRLARVIGRAPSPLLPLDSNNEPPAADQAVIERYHAISSVLPEYVYSFYLPEYDDLLTEWRSEGVQLISGYTPDEIEERGWLSIVHPDDRRLLRDRLQQIRRGEAPVIEYRIRHRSGAIRWLRDFSRPIWDDVQQRYSRFVGSSQDITEIRINEILRTGQLQVLELIATGAPFVEVFDALIRILRETDQITDWAVHQFIDADQRLELLGATGIAGQIHEESEVLRVGESASVQDVAVTNQQLMVLPDLTLEDSWAPQMQTALTAGARSMLVLPITTRNHRVEGTVTVYSAEAREMPAIEIERIAIGSRLLGMVIERDQAERALRRAHTYYQRLAEGIPAIIFIARAEPSMPLTYLSPQAFNLVGRSVMKNVPGALLLELVHPDDRAAVSAMFDVRRQGAAPAYVEFRFDSPHEERWLQCSATLIESEGQQPHWQGVLLDVTSRRRAERLLRQSQVEFRALFDNNPNLVFTLDTRGRFQRINQAMIDLTGYQEDDLLGRPFTSVLVAGEMERVWFYIRSSVRGEAQRCETEIFTRRGERISLSLTMIPYAVEQFVTGISVVAEDITERVQMQDQLQQLAFHDSLTGLPNRVMFNQHLAETLQSVERGDHVVALLFVDLDNFKMINDSLGHESGDEFLRIVADWLYQAMGPMDLVARFGGDEFIVLLRYPTENADYPIQIAEKIGNELNIPALLQGHEINVGVSIGIAIHTKGTSQPQDLLRQADIALYQSKRSGTGTLYRVFEPIMHDQIVQRLEIERDLRRAIRRNEFVAHYQPIIDLQTGDIVKVEALVRWQHRERGLLLPGAFLSIAEETGQITEIDQLLLEMASSEIARWNRRYQNRPPLLLGVNLSVRDFRQPDLAERIAATLESTGCEPQWVRFEITESTMMQDVDMALRILKQLRELGIGFSIDDFGTGYSSLSYLQRLPIDTLKIDRSFIDGLGGDDGDELMVQTIISLATALSLEVIAEGIETEQQLNRARELGCDRAQGFLIARPAPFEELVPLLDDQHDWFTHRKKTS